MDAAKLGQTDRQIALAERSESFNQWAAKQGVAQNWQQLTMQEKKDNVDRWATLRGMDLQQQGMDLQKDSFIQSAVKASQQVAAGEKTSKAISDMLTAQNKQEAYEMLSDNVRTGEFAGVDFTAIIEAIESRFADDVGMPGMTEMDEVKYQMQSRGWAVPTN